MQFTMAAVFAVSDTADGIVTVVGGTVVGLAVAVIAVDITPLLACSHFIRSSR